MVAVVVVDAAAEARTAKCDWAWETDCGGIEPRCHSPCSLGFERGSWTWSWEGGVENRQTGSRERRGKGCSMQDKDSLGLLEEAAVALNL